MKKATKKSSRSRKATKSTIKRSSAKRSSGGSAIRTKQGVTENRILMQMARESLKGKWGLAVGAFFVYMLITFVVQQLPFFGFIVSLVISGPLTLGVVLFSLALSRNKQPKFEQIFHGFENFTTALVAYLLMTLFVLLWMLLLIIPGIVAALSYAMTFYIIADDSKIDASQAIKKSKRMMYGYKWKLFCLGLRFIGWALLSILTLGIGFLWFVPYVNISMAKFYDDIKNNSSA